MRKIPLTSAHGLAMVALFVALGGTATAAAIKIQSSSQLASNVVTSAKVRDNSLQSKDIRNGSLTAADFKAGTLKTGPQGAPGAAGPVGPQGPAGPAGPAGAPTQPLVYSAVRANAKTIENLNTQIVSLTLPAGSYLVSAKSQLDNANQLQEGECRLLQGDTELDESNASIESGSGNTPFVQATVNLAQESTIDLFCDGDNVANDDLVARKARIDAIAVKLAP